MAPRADYETIIEQGFDHGDEGHGVTVVKIEATSPLIPYGIEPGDRIVRINGQAVSDLIDYQFLTGGESLLTFVVVKTNQQRIKIQIEKPEDQSLEIELETFKYRHCGNDCIFCFVDQNPAGMRAAMYFKDEDYRLSFLWGNFTTLTNTSQKDLERIATLRLSPLYVSIHTTVPEIRKQLLGIKRDDHLLDKLQFLSKHHIEMHGQIVLCPGINDGAVLERTCHDLLPFYPALNTLAIVPLGLTKYRKGLPLLQTVTPEYAGQFIDEVSKLQKKISQKKVVDYLYLADEWYLRANRELPPFAYYGRFPQIENGVGIVRKFLREFSYAKRKLPSTLKKAKRVHILTSLSAAKFMVKVAHDMESKCRNLTVQVHPTTNHFYGEMITVSGLLTGHDFYRELQGKDLGDLVLLPPDCVKQDEDIFLDDMTVSQLSRKIHCPVVACRDGATQMVQEIVHL